MDEMMSDVPSEVLKMLLLTNLIVCCSSHLFPGQNAVEETSSILSSICTVFMSNRFNMGELLDALHNREQQYQNVENISTFVSVLTYLDLFEDKTDGSLWSSLSQHDKICHDTLYRLTAEKLKNSR